MNLLVALCLVAVVAAAPPSRKTNPNDNVSILRYKNDNLGHGNYRYAFELTDGTQAEQHGKIKNEGRIDEALAVTGSFQWLGPDDVIYSVHYTADEEGYKPEIVMSSEQGPSYTIPIGVIESLLKSN